MARSTGERGRSSRLAGVLAPRRGAHARPPGSPAPEGVEAPVEPLPLAPGAAPVASGAMGAVMVAAVAQAPPREVPVRTRSFTRQDGYILAGSVASSLCLVWLVFERLLPLSGPFGFLLLWFWCFIAVYWLVVREVEGRRAATDRAISAVITSMALFLLIPLLLIVVYIVAKGLKALSAHFFTQTLATVGPAAPATAGGAAQAIVGTLEQVALAVLISVPLGVGTAVFLNEVGGRWKRPVRLFVDAMSGVPSIVAGLFIFAVWVVGFHQGFSGFAAALALSILMLPSVARTSEEVLRLVPGGLREASLALGGTEWKTTWKVVLPTARAGLVTAAILGVARGVGETAPLIMTSFGARVMNANPFSGAQDSLPKFIYQQISGLQTQIDRAWTGAMVLILIVLSLFMLARFVASRPVGGRRGAGRGPAPEILVDLSAQLEPEP